MVSDLNQIYDCHKQSYTVIYRDIPYTCIYEYILSSRTYTRICQYMERYLMTYFHILTSTKICNDIMRYHTASYISIFPYDILVYTSISEVSVFQMMIHQWYVLSCFMSTDRESTGSVGGASPAACWAYDPPGQDSDAAQPGPCSGRTACLQRRTRPGRGARRTERSKQQASLDSRVPASLRRSTRGAARGTPPHQPSITAV